MRKMYFCVGNLPRQTAAKARGTHGKLLWVPRLILALCVSGWNAKLNTRFEPHVTPELSQVQCGNMRFNSSIRLSLVSGTDPGLFPGRGKK